MPVCTQCHENKPDSEFHIEPKKKNGLRSCCKVCRSKYTKQYYKKYYQDNKEHLDTLHKAYVKRIKDEKKQGEENELK